MQSNRKPCRWGDNCRYHQQQRCFYYHPPQHKSIQVTAFSDYPSTPKIIATPHQYKTNDTMFINKGITKISYKYSFGIIGYKLDLISKQYQFLAIQHKYNKEWGFPKGHYEAQKDSNTGYDTAKREFMEETGIEVNHENIVSIDWQNPFISNYEFTRNHVLCKKCTVYFVAQLTDKAVPQITHPHEINEIRFMSMQQFMYKSKHRQTTDILGQLHKKLTSSVVEQTTQKSVTECKIDVDHDKSDKVLIILRGFPGAGKSTLSKAIIEYYGASDCISCGHDKYHWSEGEEGRGTFRFDYKIHRDTKEWCKQEISESMKQHMKCIIVDNGHFEIWQYRNYVVWCQEYKYKMLVIEIKSETKFMKRTQHLDHMKKNQFFEACLLCVMHRKRCKMQLPNAAMKQFINKWEHDSYAVMIDPKLREYDHWDANELQMILDQMKSAQYFKYPKDDWMQKERQTTFKGETNELQSELIRLQAEYKDNYQALYKRKWTKTELCKDIISEHKAPQFSMLQFNILADGLSGVYKTGKQGFDKSPRDSLYFKYRGFRILEEITRVSPDIIALEEMDQFDFMSYYLEPYGYKGYFEAKPYSACIRVGKKNNIELPPDGVAIFYKQDKFQIIKQHIYKCMDPVALLIHFKFIDCDKEFLVGVTHLKAAKDYKGEQKRLQQLNVLLHSSWMNIKKALNDIDLFIGCDLNSPHINSSGFPPMAYNSIINGTKFIEKYVKGNEDKDDYGNVIHVAKDYVSAYGLQLSSAYGVGLGQEPLFTTYKSRITISCHTIDYIFYEKENWNVTELLSIPTDEEVKRGKTYIPAWDYPSDHFAIGAVFECKK